MTMAEVKSRVTAISASVGEPAPSSIEVAKASRARAVGAATPAFWFSETPEQQEWLGGSTYAVVLHGHFEAAAVSPNERESQAKPYTTLSLVLDAKTGAVTTFNLSNSGQQQPALDELGAVSAL
jgi:hypothetical protein